MKKLPVFIVIDDDPLSNLVCQKIICQAFPAAEVKTFIHGSEGLEFLRAAASASSIPDMVLFLDINMTISGWDFLKSLTEFGDLLNSSLKVYLLSSSIDPADKARAASSKYVWSFIRKPLTRQLVKDIVARISEEEQTLRAREIHDKLGQQLMRIKMDMIWLASRIEKHDDQVKEKISASTALISEAMETTKRIDSELRPRIIDDLGLFAALEWKTGEFAKNTGIRSEIVFELSEPEFSSFVATNIFRIYEIILLAIDMYSRADLVKSRVRFLDGKILLNVQDNGTGYNGSGDVRLKATKLRVSERAESINGTARISTLPDKGLNMTLTVPFMIG